MKFLVDMNLSPELCAALEAEGWNAIHWSSVGDPRAPDTTIMQWAKDHGYIVVTHDLDFGSILAATRASGPSAVQVRTQSVLPVQLAPILIPVLRNYESQLADGVLIAVDEAHARVRVLPFG
jgi:predicted nuclease of predicted toxin-antitoxin system